LPERVAEVLEIEPDEVLSKEWQARKVMARNLFGFWTAREFAISHTE
jgi:hypothetical protein